MRQVSYIQYLAGYSKDNVGMQDIKTASANLHDMDDEHGAFLGVRHQSRRKYFRNTQRFERRRRFEDNANKQYVKQCTDFQEIEQLYRLLLNEDFVQLKNRLKAL